MPHSAEATVKPATATGTRAGGRSAEHSQPVSGVAMAAATMYEVSTQEIWSCELCSAPCMCGSATLAIVVSSACMIVASMIETVIIAAVRDEPVVAQAHDGVSVAAGASRLQVGAHALQHRHELLALGGAEAGERRRPARGR